MGFVGEGEKFAIASTVAVGGETVGRTVGMEGEDATDFFLTVAVGGEETASEATVDDFYPSAKDGNGGEEGLNPIVDAGADNEHFGAFCEGLF